LLLMTDRIREILATNTRDWAIRHARRHPRRSTLGRVEVASFSADPVGPAKAREVRRPARPSGCSRGDRKPWRRGN